jgi:GTP cyclohydrolase II
MHEAERGLFEFGRRRPLYVTSQNESTENASFLLASVEGLTDETLKRLQCFGSDSVRLVITQHRAAVMGLVNGDHRNAVSLGFKGELQLNRILELSCAVNEQPAKSCDLREASAAEIGGLRLTRLGLLLPAIVSVPVNSTTTPELQRLLDSGVILTVTTEQISALAEDSAIEVNYVSDGPVPLENAEDAHFILFGEINGIREHVAILIGNREDWSDPVPVRIHSACLTGDLFGSLRCDCGQQLQGSLRVIAASGGGIIIYMAQEGRDIGLGNKLRAYVLQQDGLDTVDADCTLGFGSDERRYSAAVQILNHLKINRIKLLTNNPTKVNAMQDGGIQVVDRQPLYGTLNRHNLRYVKAKVSRAGHLLGDMLSGVVRGQ